MGTKHPGMERNGREQEEKECENMVYWVPRSGRKTRGRDRRRRESRDEEGADRIQSGPAFLRKTPDMERTGMGRMGIEGGDWGQGVPRSGRNASDREVVNRKKGKDGQVRVPGVLGSGAKPEGGTGTEEKQGRKKPCTRFNGGPAFGRNSPDR